jgi:MoxR-like ATPase
VSTLHEVGSEQTDRPSEDYSALFGRIVDSVADVILVDRTLIEQAVATIVAEGHLLIEDRPGLGKTTMAKALAAAVGLGFHRIQCTADLLPADVLGALILDPNTQRPAFRPGPIFANVVLADELNRASPRSQSAFLEAMGERQVSVDGQTHDLPRPFMVIATQNPLDDPGTMQIPYGQRDRFLLRLSLGYPNSTNEHELLIRGDRSERLAGITPVGREALLRLQAAAQAVHVSPEVANYVLALLEATRLHPGVLVGASPRAGLAVMRAAGAMSLGHGRDYVSPDDVQLVAGAALGHRLVLTPEATLYGGDPHDVVSEILSSVPVVEASSQRSP